MDKIRVRYFVDLALIVSFLAVFGTGIVKFKQFMAFLGIDQGGLPMLQISLVHDYFGLLFGSLVIVHTILNLAFLKNMTKGIFIGPLDKEANRPCKTE